MLNNNNYTNATHLLEQGKTKDAYTAFLSIVESSTQQLHNVKFVHQTIVSKPNQYQDSIALLRCSLDQLEKIVSCLPGATTRPPVPPKPLHVKPSPEKPNTTTVKRSRGNSVSFAEAQQQTTIEEGENVLSVKKQPQNMIYLVTTEEPASMDHHQYQVAGVIEEEDDDDDDDDDDDVVIEFESAVKPTKIPSTTIAAINTIHRTLNQSSLNTASTPTAGRPRGKSQTWIVQSDTAAQPKRDSMMDVLLETIVDPNNLVKAQTNTGDSLTMEDDTYVPNIPAPPLLATHRRLQHQLDELLVEQPYNNNDMVEHQIMRTKQILEKVRTLYMSAMTIPTMLQFSPDLLAYQLTLIESSIFCAIPSQALIRHSKSTPHKRVVASMDFFNFITRSIEHAILLPQEATKRAEIIHRWIKVATRLLALNNYQTLKAAVSALGTPPIQRLKRTWECIPKKRITRLDLLNTLMSESDNYKKYRQHVQNLWSKPVVPFLGVFIHDITYLSCSKNTLRLQEVLNEVQLFQRAPAYPLVPPASLLTKRSFLKPHFSSLSTTALDTTQNTELEQQVIVQYVLMRPWVSEKTIDALSMLREPSKPRSISSPPTTTPPYGSSSPSRPSSGFIMNPSTSTTTTTTTQDHLSLSPRTHHSHYNTDETKKSSSLVGGFWPFNKKGSPSSSSVVVTLMSPTTYNNEVDDGDEKETQEEQHDSGQEGDKSGDQQRHHRSISLPANKVFIPNSDFYIPK